jgi:AmmeMemoRadiSam system protein B
VTLRKRRLPAGWYPQTAALTTAAIRGFLDAAPPPVRERTACAAIAPHAGWFYSGRLAAASVLALKSDADTVVIIGGHLPVGAPPLFFEEDAAETPLGPFEIDAELRARLREALTASASDCYQDNTIEVLLPLARFFFPAAKLLAVRLPPEPASFEAGTLLARLGDALGRSLVVLGSTDLTHYGPAYGFSPKGAGQPALDWVRTVNDRALIQAVEAGDATAVLTTSRRDQSACSAGAILGALGFARERGATHPRLLAYATSADAESVVPSSFVGYASISATVRT